MSAAAHTARREPPRPAPFSLRLSHEERERLIERAGRLPLGAYIKSVLFVEASASGPARLRAPLVDERVLAELLAKLGASRIANNLNQLAKAANSGSLVLDAENEARLTEACAEVRAMRQLLMQALGFGTKPKATSKPAVTPATAFERASSARPRL